MTWRHPDAFYCPISRQCMHDPVVLADGHTYERRHIEKWLRRHNTSPVTGLELAQKDLFPNHALRNAIEEYFQQVFSAHRRAIRKSALRPAVAGEAPDASDTALLGTIDALMECSLLVNADHSTEHILREIMDQARRIVGAEVASVFLVESESDSLVSMVNSTNGEIRIPLSAGIAGHVASTGEPVVIEDAYSDARFDRSVDNQTGFRTRSVMCVPLKAKKAVFGVAQLINKTSEGFMVSGQGDGSPNFKGGDAPGSFTNDDLQFLLVFASQAAQAIMGNSTPDEFQPRLRKQSSSFSSGGSSPSSWRPSIGRWFTRCLGKAEVEEAPAPPRPVKATKARSADLVGALSKRCSSALAEAYETWEFDALGLAEASDNQPLSTLAYYLIDRSGLMEQFGMEPGKLCCFLREIEQGYDDSNAYHNRSHAASVLHVTHALLQHTDLAALVASTLESKDVGDCDRESLVKLACLLAAAVHDFEHKGLSNDFLVRTSDDRAVRYNDLHVNENHHIAASFEVLRRPDCNFLGALSAGALRELRRLMIAIVLGTDMADSNPIAQAFAEARSRQATTQGETSAEASATAFVPASEQDATLLLQMAIKCSDLGHLALSWESHVRWVARLEDEFFAQGDHEKALGFPQISFLMDREKPGASETQVGFMDFVVFP
eukprot:CAMPEP_0170223444 /NCGR_PEP_ID=MMETSP0116_2-20130129/11422_1 /TAXON_ID=400756 /ORGANISM="Durinskia baltica, Strain CSIRO CS-38" /LENGTH=662 /DNA_ID=CAMNT_0010474147 /DNA_START=14 /DNA_END=1998 /DNA_ORIENTATION=+